MANKKGKKKKKGSKQAAAAYKGKQNPSTQKKQQPANKPANKQAQKNKPDDKRPRQNKPSNKQPQKNKPVKEQPASKAPSADRKPKPAKAPAPAKKAAPAKKSRKSSGAPRSRQLLPRLKEKLKSLKPVEWLACFTALCLVIAAIAGISRVAFDRFSVPKEAVTEYGGRNVDDKDLLVIGHDAADQEKFSDNMKRRGDVKKFDFYAAERVHIAEASDPIEIGLANPINNNCAFIVSLVDNEGNLCYRSLGIPNGYILPKIYLTQVMPYGSYDMKLVVSAYDKETYEHIGTQYSDFTLEIGFEEETVENATATVNN